MRILLACEESQAVTNELRRLGHDAFSCDVQETSGPLPEYHVKGDCVPLLREEWDLVIAFPPCTDLACSGARWFKEKQKDGRQKRAIAFFKLFTRLKCEHVAIENPVGIMSTHYRKPDQIIQPHQFGHGETKATCLWLKGLPPLRPTRNVKGRSDRIHKLPPTADRAKIRSKTYAGIARAMARQWTASIERKATS